MQSEIEKKIWETIRELEPKAEAGDADAQHHLFVLLHSEAMSTYDTSLFEKAETYLFQSAKSGFPDAIESLQNHEARKHGFTQRVKRRSET
ncbi:hypothetical protein IB232_06680 [Pseudomonas sp. PDM15]|uniref:hypothetical protein n=1 Tax=Pseudomonas sp. PDM15 TaxID=2769303 RepID=UPI00177DA698|nr:hypothetical protein [Pseudomonas sp. PDM15]MBD9424998.1 hypothetical protein [Pseudomonas sp. PDM15]